MSYILGGENVIVEDDGCSLIIHAVPPENVIEEYTGPFSAAAEKGGTEDNPVWVLKVKDRNYSESRAGIVYWQLDNQISEIVVPESDIELPVSEASYTVYLIVYYEGGKWVCRFVKDICLDAAANFPICWVNFISDDAAPTVIQYHKTGDISAFYPGYAGPFAILKKLEFSDLEITTAPTVTYCVQPGNIIPGLSSISYSFPETEIEKGNDINLKIEYDSATDKFTFSLVNGNRQPSSSTEYIKLDNWKNGDIVLYWRY